MQTKGETLDSFVSKPQNDQWDALLGERDRLALLLEVSQAIASHRDTAALLQDLAQRLPRIVPFDVINIVLHDPVRNSMRLHAVVAPEFNKTRPGLEFSMDETTSKFVWEKQRPVMIEDVQAEKNFPKLMAVLRENGVRSYCTVPLTSPLRQLGDMSFASTHKRTFSESEIAFLQQVARQVAIAVDNVLHEESAREAYRELSELKDKLAKEKIYLEEEVRIDHNFGEIIGQSKVLRRVLKEVETVAPTDSTVLIHGETGTGKELIARALHDLSNRREHTFVKLNCAAIPTGLLESELFGHERGAFTGAITQRVGRFELANGGTLFLDEVGDIPLELQPKLLRALQEQEFERLGSARTIRVNVRLVAATNRDLAQMVADGNFRRDLYYRLNVFPVTLPPLRERTEDIPLLARHFVKQFARRMNRRIETIPTDVINALVRYSWPGNVREMQNVIERAVILSRDGRLSVDPASLSTAPAAPELDEQLNTHERDAIEAALRASRGRVSGPNGAAAALGLPHSTLEFRIRKLGIDKFQFRHRGA